MSKIAELIKQKVLVLDGAMGTQIQSFSIREDVWNGKNGCNEYLNLVSPDIIKRIYNSYLMAGADIIKTNTFGSMDWVLEEYELESEAYNLSFLGAKLAKEAVNEYLKNGDIRFVAGSIGPGTKLPSLGHIHYDKMYSGYKEMAIGLIDGGVDIFLIETAQDPLQIKVAIHALNDASLAKNVSIPIMVSVTIELQGSMLIGTDAQTIATILEPFNILSLGFNCGTGPKEVERHVKILSEVSKFPISIHSNAGLPQNRGGYTFYPMHPEEFSLLQENFLNYDGVALLGGCCGTTPQHIKALKDRVKNRVPKPPKGNTPKALASLFNTFSLNQNPPPLLVGERTNATGSKAFRDLLIAEDYEGTLSVAQEQVRVGSHILDVSVGFAGRDELKDTKAIFALYSQKIALPLMVDSTSPKAIVEALKLIGGRAIINSVNFEDGEEKFDAICQIAKRYGSALVALCIDEKGMAKSIEDKIKIAKRIYERATKLHKIDSSDLVFDLLTFTVGSGEKEYFDSAINTIEGIRELKQMYPEVGTILGVSNISFGLKKEAREYLNSVFLYHCVNAGLTSAIINVKSIMPYSKMKPEDIKVCEDLLFNKREESDPLFTFIAHFSDTKTIIKNDEVSNLSTREKIYKYLVDGNRDGMLKLLPIAKDEIESETIINDILINAMKEVGELFGSGKMQLPFVLQSAEVMKASVDYLNPFLPKKDNQKKSTIVLGTVKGDVHDVGKNLVDIILTNNGFNVVNIGIKADLEDFVRELTNHNADAIGMSGLLVKSTLIMKENLIELKNRGISTPILLGGAALNKKFVDEDCRSSYDGAIFYCRDAFDGIVAMSRITNNNLDTNLGEKVDEYETPKLKKEHREIDMNEVTMPKPKEPLTPPFWGRRVFNEIDKELAFSWLNHKILFKQRWGYSSKGKSKDEYEKQHNEIILPHYERLKKQFIAEELFQPTIIYGYYPAHSKDSELLIFDEKFGYLDINRRDIDKSLKPTIRFKFPRQQKVPHRSISDYFFNNSLDVVALSVVSSGSRLSEYEAELFKNGNFSEYYLVHGLGVELAEALAEIVHKQVRIELGITKNYEESILNDVRMNRYSGCRYSFGYPACPDLEGNVGIFDLLKPEEFGITLSESFQIVPEQSTSAIIVPHFDAIYYSI